MMSFNTKEVFVMFGSGCNKNCRYCLQGHNHEKNELPTDITNNFYKVLEDIKESSEDKVVLSFYGGEPLLYFDKIKQIVEYFEPFEYDGNRQFQYDLKTNGTLLTKKMVDFFNMYDFHVTISWDGKYTEKTRGYNVFKDPLFKDLTHHINNFGICSVLTAYSYPMDIVNAVEELDEERNQLKVMSLSIELLSTMTDLPEDVADIDIYKVSTQVENMITRYQQHTCGPVLKQFMDKTIEVLKSDYKELGCRSGYDILNIDLHGNKYACHNDTKPIAGPRGDYFKYLNDVLAGDTTIMNRKVVCKERMCPVIELCGGGCRYIPINGRDDLLYCNLREAVYYPFMQLFGKA